MKARSTKLTEPISSGLLLSACQVLSHTEPVHLRPAGLPVERASTLGGLLGRIRSSLHSANPMLRLFGTRCLRALPSELWAGTGEDGEGQPPMGEKEWDRIMKGLDARDAGLRKEVSVGETGYRPAPSLTRTCD